MIIPLLTPEQVAEQLSIDVKKVSRLPITRVRIGARVIRYRQEDVDLYIGERLELPGAQSTKAARGRQDRGNEHRWTHVGLISRDALDKLGQGRKVPLETLEDHSADDKRRITRLKSIVERVAKKRAP